MMHEDVCIYTVLIGNYEPVDNAMPNIETNIRKICFTDDTNASSDHWEIRHVQPIFPMDPIRSQRAIKICSHQYLRDFRKSIYVDSGIALKIKPEELFEKYAAAQLAIVRHSFRETLLDEFIEVSRLGLDDQSRIFEQLNHYEIYDPDLLSEPVFWGAIVLRDHASPRVQQFSELWFAHVLRYSRRDQLSLNWAIKHSGVEPTAIMADNHSSWFHDWKPGERKRQHPLRDPRTMMMPARARRREEELFPPTASPVPGSTAPAMQALVRSLAVGGSPEKNASLGQVEFLSLDRDGRTTTFARDYTAAPEIESRHEVGERWFSIVDDGEIRPALVLARPNCDTETSVFLRWKHDGKDLMSRVMLEPDGQGFARLKINLNP